ncbi:MAG: bifunctional diaminohydroxyphosphoribosylaminopyrimidine deaminase/5-amino-6-(5-phosphoribosylamino)uracil reductase RibD [Burkholderiales bacterium]|nr:bifunctional diaminohydroxyphosphoribosylaminopyrimidine deaminase/5-amino-6-(5-phosphoribosylamino)uracil reductase RibD [Burkholderiales bacterium]
MHQYKPKSLVPKSTLERALQLAATARHNCPPNPAVGCIVVNADATILGQGSTQSAGGPHAEIMALRDAQTKGHSVKGATAYVTLEPCAHHGRTGPCCDALIAAGIQKVVATNTDPNPLVAGQGFARLRAAGIEVEVLPPGDPLAVQARDLNIGFFSRMVRKTPWVRMKVAASLDGKTALTNGLSQWITSTEARADGHAWRARSCAVLTGIGTILADDPQLDVRLIQTTRQPHVVIVDSHLRIPLDAKVLCSGRTVYIYTAVANTSKQAELEQRGAKVIHCPQSQTTEAQPAVDLQTMLLDLGRREINELHVEAGQRLNGSLVRHGLVDELLVYLAPKFIGQGRDMAHFGPLVALDKALQLDFSSVELVGPDVRLVARVRGRDDF